MHCGESAADEEQGGDTGRREGDDKGYGQGVTPGYGYRGRRRELVVSAARAWRCVLKRGAASCALLGAAPVRRGRVSAEHGAGSQTSIKQLMSYKAVFIFRVYI